MMYTATTAITIDTSAVAMINTMITGFRPLDPLPIVPIVALLALLLPTTRAPSGGVIDDQWLSGRPLGASVGDVAATGVDDEDASDRYAPVLHRMV